ncbi:hypothetical protein [Nocardia uniformis]|nr:hypothetical protein [Nocardia uniformis]
MSSHRSPVPSNAGFWASYLGLDVLARSRGLTPTDEQEDPAPADLTA